MKSLIKITIVGLVIGMFSCKGPGDEDSKNDPDDTSGQVTVVTKPLLPNNFNADSAYVYIEKQVSFGPRVPNTEPHRKCALWIEKMLKRWSDTTYIQAFDAKSYKGEIWKAKNIIGSFNPKNPERLLLCAHWDTRPQADQDPKDPFTPSDGANDGASGVGVLLEIARQLHAQKPALGIDIVLFDVEDGGTNGNEAENSWCLGSQFWAKQPHVPDYRAKNGILLDMVGAKNAVFAREGMSAMFDNNFLGRVWNTASKLGYANYFINYSKDGITDDHVYISQILNIPTIDIIDFDAKTPSGFGAYWHTHGDNMSTIDKKTLTAVGRTVLQVALNSEANIY